MKSCIRCDATGRISVALGTIGEAFRRKPVEWPPAACRISAAFGPNGEAFHCKPAEWPPAARHISVALGTIGEAFRSKLGEWPPAACRISAAFGPIGEAFRCKPATQPPAARRVAFLLFKKSLAKEKSVLDCRSWSTFAGGADRLTRPRPEAPEMRRCCRRWLCFAGGRRIPPTASGSTRNAALLQELAALRRQRRSFRPAAPGELGNTDLQLRPAVRCRPVQRARAALVVTGRELPGLLYDRHHPPVRHPDQLLLRERKDGFG
ncbi:hypothetical protein [Paenibacillus thiaminolyticus]|uniref:hypothetical protein n=1 Tax=Paenibacillus thiaminolyticus TaxID=49283 RepID=UPI0011C3722C|nr:hypothetical protein [Paenibacillus thiaminolyticus]